MTGKAATQAPDFQFPVAEGGGSLTLRFVERIREMIQTGALPLGAKLPAERELAQTLRVSRPSVRQGIKALEAMRIIVSRPGIGNFVSADASSQKLLKEPIQFAISANKISREKLYEFRRVIEVQVAGLAARRATAEQRAVIRRELQQMERCRHDPRELAMWDSRFHMAIVRACGNETFGLLFEPIAQLIWKELSDRVTLYHPDRLLSLHRAILRAIEGKDAAGAMRAMKKHLDVGYKLLLGSGGSVRAGR